MSVVVARQPPRYVVAIHCELAALLLDKEIVEVWLLRELITETYAVVINAETKNDITHKHRWTLLYVRVSGTTVLPQRLLH